jgi:RND family efflux transporter MFP subunit
MPFLDPRLTLVCLLATLPALAGTPLKGQILPNRQVEVSAPVSSRILEMKVKEGDTVKAGQPLAILYGRLEELEMQRAKALLERREFESKGSKRLYENRIIPEARALEASIDLELARLQYETALEQVRLRTVLSPMDGVVVRRSQEAGETVSMAQPLFRILDLSSVVVQCAADPERLASFPLGQKVRVRLHPEPGGPEFPGLVALVDPCADAEGKVRVKILVENPGLQIRSGFRAWVEPAEKP